MICPRCGSQAQAVQGHCPVCGYAPDDAPTAELANAETPTSPGAGNASPGDPDARTRTGVGALLGADAPTGAAGAGVVSSEAPTGTGRGGVLPPDAATGTGRPSLTRTTGPLSPGADFGSRYHIIRMLGSGGMGAVYQAWDKVLEVAVAVKVIRPPETEDPEAARALERRFKRELLLARQVTHKHVVRIHDLGEIDGTTYITMPYVQGSDLASILRRDGKLPVERAISIAKQVAAGLAAAHDAGIVHRDLKPANIMVDAEGDALIMDFGIARSATATAGSLTAGGAIVGTIEYMAPEQARASPVDHRADIYAFGLILYDMLLGRRQSGPSTAVAELMSRMQQAPPSPRSVDPSVPAALDAIVTRCIQPDPVARYQSMAGLRTELDLLTPDGHRALTTATGVAIPSAVAAPVPARRHLKWLLVAAAVLVLAGAAWAFRGRLFGGGTEPKSAATGPVVSIAILPFKNASSDPALDSLGSNLSQVLATELGQSARVRTVPPDRLMQVLRDLQIAPNATLAPAELSRVAEFTSARRVLWGQYARFGEQIRIDATLQDFDRGSTVPLNAMAANESGLLAAISALAESVRQDLARGSPDILQELKSTSWKPSTSSFEALRFYNEGQQRTQQGTYQQALKSFEAATKADSNFALAYSALARTYSALGYDAEASQNSRRAMQLADALPPQEKYLIAANHYGIVNDTDKAIEAYENLVSASPTSVTAQFDLGGLYEQSGALEKARDHYAKVVELDPKFVEGRLARGRVEIKMGSPQASLDHLNAALTLAIQLNQEEARGNILQAIGIAYKLMDKPDEALGFYQQSLDIKKRLGNKRGMAGSLGEIAQIQERLGKPKEAEQGYREALALQRQIGEKSGTSTTLINLAGLFNETLGRPDDALPLLREALQIRRDIGDRPGEALVLNNLGNVYLMKGEFADAQTQFERALDLREQAKVAPDRIADTVHNLGETLAKMGKSDQSLTRYLRALDLRRAAGNKRGAAIESYSVGTIFDAQGRYGAAVKSKEEALQTFRELKVRDSWLAETLGGYGASLSLAGRMDEAAKPLDEALALAKDLQNHTLIAQTLRLQAERLFYSGDLKGAAALNEQATQAAAKAADRSLTLMAQASAAITSAAAQPTRAIAAKLASLADEADKAGLKSLSVQCSIERADALLKSGDRAAASQEADRALAKADTLGFRLSQAKAHFVKAEAMRLANDQNATREYAQTLRILNDIKAEDGSQNVIKRADVGAMIAESEKRSRATSAPIPAA